MTHSNTMANSLTQAQPTRAGGGSLLRFLLLPFLLCACFVGGGAAMAADDNNESDNNGAALLKNFWEQTPGAKAEFRQRVYDDDGELLSDGGGRLWFERGGKFRVEYDSPEALLLLADGERFWSYEKDLQQVIVRPLASLGGGFLAALSAGEWSELLRYYDLSPGGAEDNLQWVQARSKNDEDAVRRIVFGFDDDGVLRRLRMHDAFGGMVRVDINNLTIGAGDGVFVFVPPPNAEIITDQ